MVRESNDLKKRPIQTSDELRKIFHLLHERTKIDFSEYKQATINRRIQKRMMLNRITNVKKYLAYLQNTPDEVITLQKDLLITITSFFRDPEKFAALSKVVFPEIVAQKTNREPIRIWVPGCATGEEAYSIAITLSEFLGKKHSFPIQIFATDIKSTVIKKAREGSYSENIVEHISPQRLLRFFTKVENGYLVTKDIREKCVFTMHDLTQNPPFSNLDFISCQNVLIYLTPQLQKKILSLFHYALNPNGFLMLGNSESIGMEKKYFHVVDTKHKIYSKKIIESSTSRQAIGDTDQEKTKDPLPFPKQGVTQMNIKKIKPNATDLLSRLEKINKLRDALALSQEYADSLVNELNSIAEELQSTNEELLVNNEELQTTNEELETSQEELESANEELLTLNTELQKREEALARLAAIVQSSDDAIISKSRAGIITSWNEGAERLYGYKAEEIIGKPVSVLLPQGKKSDFPEIMHMLLKGKRVEHYETQRMTKDGRILDVSITVSPLKDAKGRIIGASKIARDITEKKQTEKNLKFLSDASKILASNFDYQSGLNSVVKLAVPEIGDWCTIDMLYDGALKLVAVAHKDPKKVKWAKELRKIYPPDMNDSYGVPNVLRTGKSELYPDIPDEILVASAKDAKQLKLLRSLGFTSAMIIPISIAKKAIGAITFVTTESRKRYNKQSLTIAEELAGRISLNIEHVRLYREAQKAISIRDEFISVASHELKTPITSLKMYTQVIKSNIEQEKNNVSTYPLIKMDEQIKKLTNLMSDLLNVSRIQLGKLEFHRVSFDLTQLAKSVIETVQSTTQKHTIILEGAIQKHVTGDKDRIGQVITNLLTNAIKYSPNAHKVIVRLTSETDAAVVTVQDFGIGINTEHQKRIFERFYRVNSAEERTFPGLGLGLYISHQIIQRHGGEMSVASNKGKGSQFSFTVPFKAQKDTYKEIDSKKRESNHIL